MYTSCIFQRDTWGYGAASALVVWVLEVSVVGALVVVGVLEVGREAPAAAFRTMFSIRRR